MLTNDQAICIRAIDYSETSQVVTFFARQTGKVTMIAKGAKRQRSPFGGPIEMLSCGNVVFSDSGHDKLATLVEFEPLADAVNASVLAADLFVLNCCLFAGELVNVLTKDYDPHPGLFDGLLAFLRDVSRHKISDAAGGRVLARLVSFQLSLLKEIGLSPVLEYCVNCSTVFDESWPEVYFSHSAKGLICRDCQGAFPDKTGLAREGAKCLADLSSVAKAKSDAKLLASADDPTVRQIEEILIHYITDVLGRPPKMAKYVLGLR
ncbi:MAG: DNA repair protein RecO [Sedimentisphaerales bacterium]|jgi:DNA repair protein RecO (recombination protein O)